MLVFWDESGDAGMKLGEGSSAYFIVTAVVFLDRDVANACDMSINDLRSSLGLAIHKEFHFNRDSHELRRSFLAHVAQFEFYHSSVVIQKELLTSQNFRDTKTLYKYTVNLAVSNIISEMVNAIFIFDRCGGRGFNNELKTYVRKKIRSSGNPDDAKRVTRIRDDKSHTNNLLQMADMVCGAVARSYNQQGAGRNHYRRILRERERRVQVWPKPPP